MIYSSNFCPRQITNEKERNQKDADFKTFVIHHQFTQKGGEIEENHHGYTCNV